jgi:hypothetical protein
MSIGKIFKRLFFLPIRKIGRTVINLIIFDIAVVIYGCLKKWRFRKKPNQESEADSHIQPDPECKRRW